MTQRGLLGLVLAGAAVAAVLVPAHVDAESSAPAPVTPMAIDPAELEGVPSSSAPTVGTGELSPAPSPLVQPEATPGPPQPQFIIGVDSRMRVTPTTGYPARAVASIYVDPAPMGVGGASSFSCTGWMYSPDALATAAHCVYLGPEGAFYTVRPGRDGATEHFTPCTSVQAFYPSNWDGTGPTKNDYAAFDLGCNYGTQLGWFGFRQVKDGKLDGLEQTIAGYPADKHGEQWKSKGKIRRVTKGLVFYKNDTKGGMSGGPVYKKFAGCGTCAVALHTSGYGTPTYPIENGGTRIRPAVGQFLNAVDAQSAP